MIIKTSSFKKSGFTLLDLMVSLALVVIMTGMAMANFSSYRASANDSIALSAAESGLVAMQDFLINRVQTTDDSSLACFYPNGTTTFYGTVQGTPFSAAFLPGYRHKTGVGLYLSLGGGGSGSSGPTSYQVISAAFHCKGTRTGSYASPSVKIFATGNGGYGKLTSAMSPINSNIIANGCGSAIFNAC